MGKTWTKDEVAAWFAGRLPDDWFDGPPEVTIDREEVLVVGTLADPEVAEADGDDGDPLDVARAARIGAHREDTRDQRVRIAADAEHLWGRKVSWGARCGDREDLFTTASVPVMTRLRMPERKILDTLIDGGVAKSRSEALAWCVRLVGRHEADWISELQDAVAKVTEARKKGPDGVTTS